uniref:Endonuclease/exonuclease/phosphatase domain-containing protein n=1 Tax=Biomphalaria glabrata TaxID=6526 RepID=A0A2C9L7L6_BIOGL
MSKKQLQLDSKQTKSKSPPFKYSPPTEDAEDTTKDNFYNQLQTILEETLTDLILLMEDFNAKINPNRTGFEYVITRSPNGETFNEIDYIFISKRWRSSLLDVRTRRGADISSDHYHVSGKCNLRLKRRPKRATRPRPFNVDKLKECNIAAQFQLKLKNRFETLADILNLEEEWANFKDTTIECAKEVIGRRRGSYKERWIQDRTWKLIDERKDAKSRQDQKNETRDHILVEEAYREADLKVKRSCR